MVASVLPLPEKPLGEESGTREEIEARRSQAFRENRLSQLTQPGGVAVLVDPEGRGEVTVPIRGSVSLNALERAIDGTQAIELTRAREDTAVRMEAGLMRGWLETELDKIEARRKWTKARWWRRLNRIMSLIGLLLLGAIVSFHALR